MGVEGEGGTAGGLEELILEPEAFLLEISRPQGIVSGHNGTTLSAAKTAGDVSSSTISPLLPI